ncbi:MAG: hypothetical protein OEL87_00090 [Nanoarchaeota archaeon]|nr:hypothetical protein [Nanoarchaeota archaeon]
MSYECRSCKDKGYVQKEDGKLYECKNCKPVIDLKQKYRPNNSELGEYAKKKKGLVEKRFKSVENMSEHQIRDLQIQIVDKVLFLHAYKGSWGKVEKALNGAISKPSLINWSKGRHLPKTPDVLIGNLTKLKTIEVAEC